MSIPTESVLAFWGLETNPFDIQGRIGEATTVTASMRSVTDFVVRQAKAGGTSAVLGDVGDGKTTALRAAKRTLSKDPANYLLVAPVTLATGAITPPTMVRLIYEGHGTYAPRTSGAAGKVSAVIGLIEGLPAQTVILLDEAHLLHVSLVRMVKELADATSRVSVILVGHKMPFLTRMKKIDSKDVTDRLQIGRIIEPPPLTLEDATRILEQRRVLVAGTPVFPAEVVKEILAHRASPMGVLGICWVMLMEGARTQEREMNLRLLRGAMGRAKS